MAEIVRELPGNPSHVLDSLASRLTSDGWNVTTRSGPLLQVARDGRSLTLTVLGSAHGTRVHAEGSRDAIIHLRRAIGPESTSPKDFSLRRGGLNLGGAILSGMGLASLAVGFLVLAAFCQSSSSSDVRSSVVGDSNLQADGVGEPLGENAGLQEPPSATPALARPTPTPLAAAAPLRPRPTPTSAIPSVTPPPPAPTPTAAAATPASAPVTLTPTPAPPRATVEPGPPATPAATPTLDLSRLADAHQQ